MKTRNHQSSLLAVAAVAALVFTSANVTAQDSTIAAAQPAVASQPAPQLSYGVPQVLQLVQARVSDSIIVSYVQNSGTIYSLTASEIVYLKQLGVSDNVLNTMLNQRSRVSSSTQPATTTASAPASSDQTYAAAAPAAAPVTYVQQAAQPSTVYVVPNTQTYYYSYPYYSYPYYGGYYYGWPAVSLSFGWGGYNYYGGSGYHGGYNGGYHGSSGGGGGSWHGGGGGGTWGGGSGGGYHGGGGGGHH